MATREKSRRVETEVCDVVYSRFVGLATTVALVLLVGFFGLYLIGVVPGGESPSAAAARWREAPDPSETLQTGFGAVIAGGGSGLAMLALVVISSVQIPALAAVGVVLIARKSRAVGAIALAVATVIRLSALGVF